MIALSSSSIPCLTFQCVVVVWNSILNMRLQLKNEQKKKDLEKTLQQQFDIDFNSIVRSIFFSSFSFVCRFVFIWVVTFVCIVFGYYYFALNKMQQSHFTWLIGMCMRVNACDVMCLVEKCGQIKYKIYLQRKNEKKIWNREINTLTSHH